MSAKKTILIGDGANNFRVYGLIFDGLTIEDNGDGTVTISGGGGGSSDHASLSHLAWAASGHTGTASRFAVFNSVGASAYLSYPSTGLVAWDGSGWLTPTVDSPLSYSGEIGRAHV